MSIDRRRQTRVAREDLGLVLVSGGRELREPEVLLRDISRGGIGFATSGTLTVGQLLEFRLELPSGAVSGTAAVRWVEPLEAGCRCGAEFRALGLLQRWRLKGLFDPALGDPGELIDRALALAAGAVACLVLLDLLGVDLASPAQFFDFLFR